MAHRKYVQNAEITRINADTEDAARVGVFRRLVESNTASHHYNVERFDFLNTSANDTGLLAEYEVQISLYGG